MDFVEKKNKIKKKGFYGIIACIISIVILLCIDFIFVSRKDHLVTYWIILGLCFALFVVAIFVFVFCFQVRAREYKIKNHKVQIYAGTKKTIIAVDNKIIHEIKVFQSIKKSIFGFLFKRKKLKLSTMIASKEFTVEVGSFNSLNVRYDGDKIEPIKK